MRFEVYISLWETTAAINVADNNEFIFINVYRLDFKAGITKIYNNTGIGKLALILQNPL